MGQKGRKWVGPFYRRKTMKFFMFNFSVLFSPSPREKYLLSKFSFSPGFFSQKEFQTLGWGNPARLSVFTLE